MLPTTKANPQSGPAVAVATTIPNPRSLPAPTSDIAHPTLPSTLSPEDRTKLSTLFRTRGDAVSFASLREEDPLDTLLWLDQPHIKPWHDAIRNAHREHEATETHLSLARALKDITRILDLEADSTLRIRAVNAIIKLANAIHRGSKHSSFRTGLEWTDQATRHQESHGGPFPKPPNQAAKLATEARRADLAAGDALARLDLHTERRTRRTQALEDANLPAGTVPTWVRNDSCDPTLDSPSSPLKGASDGCQGSRGSASAPLVAGPKNLQHPSGVHEARDNSSPQLSRRTTDLRAPHKLNGTHKTLAARAGTPRPPPKPHRSRKHR